MSQFVRNASAGLLALLAIANVGFGQFWLTRRGPVFIPPPVRHVYIPPVVRPVPIPAHHPPVVPIPVHRPSAQPAHVLSQSPFEPSIITPHVPKPHAEGVIPGAAMPQQDLVLPGGVRIPHPSIRVTDIHAPSGPLPVPRPHERGHGAELGATARGSATAGHDAPAAKAVASSAVLEAAVTKWAHNHLGKQVGDGQCGELADVALQALGAKPFWQLGPTGPDADYVWGSRVLKYGSGQCLVLATRYSS